MSDTTTTTPQLITGENDTIDTRATTTSDTTTDATKTAKKVCPPHNAIICDYKLFKMNRDIYLVKCSICSIVYVVDRDYRDGNLYRFVKFKYNWRYSKMFKRDSHYF